jgi:two-component system cell cycle sensor histidine kinase PleC
MLTTERSDGANTGFDRAQNVQSIAQNKSIRVTISPPKDLKKWSATDLFDASKLFAALCLFAAAILFSQSLEIWQQALLLTGTIAFLLMANRMVSLFVPAVPAPRVNKSSKLHETLNHMPHGIAHWDAHGKLVWCNKAYRRLLGIKKSRTVPGASYAELMTEANKPITFKAINDDENHRIVMARCEDEKIIRIEDIADQEQNFVTVVTDSTEFHKTTAEKENLEQRYKELARQYHAEKLAAEAASRAKTSFLAHLSHDMRTPLNHIIGFADLIQHEPYGELGDKRYAGYVADIKRSGEALRDSFSDILELAQLEAGETVQNNQEIDVYDFTQKVIKRHQARAQRAGIDLDAGNLADAKILADNGLMQRMLDNLVDNAIRFTPESGYIVLSCWEGTDGVVFEVTDTGIGMPRERVELLSQPFVLGEAAFTKEHKGLGLGIATSRAIAELAGGTLTIDSNPGIGTTVVITVPRKVQETSLENAA